MVTAQGIEYDEIRSRALTDVAEAQSKAGLVKEALVTVQGVEDDWQRIRALLSVVTAMPR